MRISQNMSSYKNIEETDFKKLCKYGYKKAQPKKNERIRLVKDNSVAILYNTGTMLLQGEKDSTERLIKFLGIVKETKLTGLAIGTDEALKGDTFGGIVVAGFIADDKIRQELKDIGVKDSKDLLKPECVRLAILLQKKYSKNYHVENILPREYNKLNLKLNVTEIMNLLHEKCYKKLSSKQKVLHIVDKYPGCSVGDIVKKNAESKYVEVAAASIIARFNAIKQIRELEAKAGFFIPMGSTHVESALLEIRKKSLRPENFVKLKFRNVKSFFG